MRARALLALPLLTAAALTAAGPADAAAPKPTTFTAAVVKLTNAERAKAGCGPLAVSALLTRAARAHAADMARRDYFSHTGRDGRSPFDRIEDTGYRFSTAGENIAAGQRTARDVVAAWMSSPGHRANILTCAFTEIGMGYATGGGYGVYWTQDLARPAR